MSRIDKEYFARAALEVSNGNIDSALYVKALALNQGSEVAARANYISLRAEELHRIDEALARMESVSKTRVIAARAGKISLRLILGVLSLCLPGLGQLFSRRYRSAAKFFASWVALQGIGFFVQFTLSDSSGDETLLVTIPLLVANGGLIFWSAFDAFANFGRSRSTERMKS